MEDNEVPKPMGQVIQIDEARIFSMVFGLTPMGASGIRPPTESIVLTRMDS